MDSGCVGVRCVLIAYSQIFGEAVGNRVFSIGWRTLCPYSARGLEDSWLESRNLDGAANSQTHGPFGWSGRMVNRRYRRAANTLLSSSWSEVGSWRGIAGGEETENARRRLRTRQPHVPLCSENCLRIGSSGVSRAYCSRGFKYRSGAEMDFGGLFIPRI